MNNNRLLRVLSIKPFLFLWLAEIFSQIAMNMVNFVLIIAAFKLANSNTAVSGVVLSFTVPAIIFGMLAGVYVDRWNKKSVLFATNAIRVILLLLLLTLHTNLFFIYLLSFAVATVTQFFIPAETPMIPLLVGKKLLLTANALFGMGIYGSALIAYGLSGPLLLLFGQRNVFLILALSFFLAAIFVLLIKTPKKRLKKRVGNKQLNLNLASEVKSAFSLMTKTKEIYNSLILLTLSQILILILAVIGPGYARQILGIGVDEFPLFFVTPAALGIIMGSIILGNFFHNASKEKSVTIGVLLSGMAILLLPYGSKVASRSIITAINAYLPNIFVIDILHIMIFLAFVFGIANALVFVPSNTIIQEKTSDEFRGKVYGALNTLVGVGSLFPIIIVGELADLLGVGKVLTGIGISILVIGVIRLLRR